MFSGRGERQSSEPDVRVYSRSKAGTKPRSPETRNISKHPVISILRRIDELNSREEAGHSAKQQGDQTLAELEACLAAIQQGTN